MAHLAIDEGELMVGHALHEVAVVGDEQKRARPAVEQALHGGQHVGVQIVAGLVQDEHVGLVEQDEHEREPPLLATRQVAHRLVLIVLREAQALEQLARGHLLTVEHGATRVAGDHLAHPVVAELRQLVQMLGEHREAHGLTDLHPPPIERLEALDDAQKRGLADAVGAHDAVAVPGPDDPVHIVQDHSVAEGKRGVLQLHHGLAEPRHGHALELQFVAQGRHVGNERLGRGHVELGLGGPSPRAAREPRQFAAQGVLPLLLGQSLQPVALHPLHDVGGKAALEGPDPLTVHLPHGLAHLVKKPAVVGHHEQGAIPRAPTGFQMIGEPCDGLHVQVVSRLVQHEHVPVANEQPRQVHPATLTARERAHQPVPGHIVQKPRDDGTRAGIAGPLVFGAAPYHGPPDRIFIAQAVGLAEHAHRHTARADNATTIHFHLAGKHAEQRGFAVAVLTHDTDAGALIYPEGQLGEHCFRGEFHPHFFATEKKCHGKRLSIIGNLAARSRAAMRSG